MAVLNDFLQPLPSDPAHCQKAAWKPDVPLDRSPSVPRILIVKRNRLCTDHLHTDQSGSLLLTEHSKWQICNTCHWCKHKGILDLYISDFPLHLHEWFTVLVCMDLSFFLQFFFRDVSQEKYFIIHFQRFQKFFLVMLELFDLQPLPISS